MISFFQARRLPNGRRSGRGVTLGLEQLETRDCPAAPVLSLTAVPLNSGRLVQIQGTVQDENPATVSINLSGVVSGTITPNANGTFTHVAEASGLGFISASAMDEEGLPAMGATAMIASNAPTLTLALTRGPGRTVTLSGVVTDEEPGGRTVVFTGKVTGSTVTDANGAYSFTAEATGAGYIYAQTTDAWGTKSNKGSVLIGNTPPEFGSFLAIEGEDNIWTIQGTVIDEDPGGLVVTLGGLPSVEGTTVVVQSDGTFIVTIRIDPSEHGSITADTTDWYGVNADQALTLIQ